MYEYPEYIEAEKNIENLIQSIQNSLQVWLDIHTDAEAWASDWAMGEEWQYMLEISPIIENDYFSFDLKEECKHIQAKKNLHLFNRCLTCNSILDSEWDCNYCESEGQEPDYDQLTDDDFDELIEWLDEFDDCNNTYTDDIIIKAMVTKGFECYQQALNGTIIGIVEETKEALEKFEYANNNQERLDAAMIASSILHVNGNILEDYGERIGLDNHTVNTYRDDGLTALFDREEIREFILEGQE